MYKIDKFKLLLPHLLMGGITLLLFGVATELGTNLLGENQLERKHSSVVEKVATVRAKIEGEFNATLFLSAGLMAHVATHPDIDEQEFTQIASKIIARGRNIKNLGLAKDNIVTHIFPLAGNEAALGLEYKKLSSQWPAIARAIELKDTVVAGPINLVQGGKGFIVRTPIYTSSDVSVELSKHKSSYWGLASIVIYSDGFFKSAEFAEVIDGIAFAILGEDGLGDQGSMIMGNEKLFELDPVISTVNLPNGSWQIAALPVGGWQQDRAMLWILRACGWLIALSFAILISALSLSTKRNRELAFHDHLTKLPNRLLLEDRILQVMAYSTRYKASFGLFNLDLDKFKYINDKFGHKVGDGLLVEVAKRLLASVRTTDTVARVGGDEFIVLVNDVHNESDMLNIRQQIEKNVIGAAYINGLNLNISASIGFAVYPDDADSIEELKNIADERMYASKQINKA